MSRTWHILVCDVYRVNFSVCKAGGFDTTFTNALIGEGQLGGAFGGADFNPYTKSETEIQVCECIRSASFVL